MAKRVLSYQEAYQNKIHVNLAKQFLRDIDVADHPDIPEDDMITVLELLREWNHRLVVVAAVAARK